MSEQTHGWGFCDATTHLPDDLFLRAVRCYISTVYYAGVAMVGKRFMEGTEIIKVDAWKAAFSEEDVFDAFRFFFCDALPNNYEQMIKDEIRKHPLKNVAPATIPLSTSNAKVHWANAASAFLELEGEIDKWVSTNSDKLPHALPGFRFGEFKDEGDNDESDYFF